MRQRAARAPSVAPEGDSSWFREEHVPFLSPPFSSLALACLEAVSGGPITAIKRSGEFQVNACCRTSRETGAEALP